MNQTKTIKAKVMLRNADGSKSWTEIFSIVNKSNARAECEAKVQWWNDNRNVKEKRREFVKVIEFEGDDVLN